MTQRVPATEGSSRRQAGGGERAWLAVLWTRAECIYSSGLAGQLLRWRLGEGDSCQVRGPGRVYLQQWTDRAAAPLETGGGGQLSGEGPGQSVSTAVD